MKNYLIGFGILAIFFACKNDKNADQNSTTSSDTHEAFSYAELSIAEGGEWKGRVYEDADTFMNVNHLKVPEEHTDHSWYIRYEGPGWESDKVAYRLYLDWRNATDIFGKKVHTPVLQQVGQISTPSYHELSDWGMDVLKVGEGLGIGSIGRIVDGKMYHFEEVDSTVADISNNSESSAASIHYYGWKTKSDKIDLESTYSIRPSSRVTKHVFTPSKSISGICTGIVNHDVEYTERVDGTEEWGYIATYGEQSLVPDKLGMAVFFNKNDVEQITKGPSDHLVIFKPSVDPITYYFAGAWEQEPHGIKTKEEFIAYLDQVLEALNKNEKI